MPIADVHLGQILPAQSRFFFVLALEAKLGDDDQIDSHLTAMLENWTEAMPRFLAE